MDKQLQISVVIPTYQRRDSVERTLHSLAYQTLAPEEYEVIVSIDGSIDGTLEMVENLSTPYTLRAIWHPNSGRAASCNLGILLAQGQVVVLLDDDMEVTTGFLAAHLRMHTYMPFIAVIGAAPIQWDLSSPPLVSFTGQWFDRRLEKFAQPKYKISFHEAYSGNFSILRNTMLQIGGFDEDFKVYGYEDYELSLRLVRHGVELMYSAEALAYQSYTKDTASVARDNVSRGANAVLFASKHPEIASQLKLGSYKQVSFQRRVFRDVLLMISCYIPHTINFVIHIIQWLEQQRSSKLNFYYELVFDYCYWLGVRQALSIHSSFECDTTLSSLKQL